MRRSVACLVLCLLLVSRIAHPQSTNATITGTVNDSGARVLPSADVEIVNNATGVHYTAKTNRDGIYDVSILPPGTYTVQASKIGFKTIITPDVTLNVQAAVALNFVLPVGAASETITVEAGSLFLNTADASVSTVIDKKFVANMPLNGRSFQDLISMTPGVTTANPQSGGSVQGTGDFSVNGQRTQSNAYTVDGVSGNLGAGNTTGFGQPATSGSVAASTALGTTQSLVSVDALQEFKVSSSSYSAEYGRTPGGQFSFSTRSGTNTLHGTAFDYLRNDAFDANDYFNNRNGLNKTALRQNDFGGTVGGPILAPHLYNGRGKSFFFASYEGLRLTQPTAATPQYVPSLAVRAGTTATLQPLLNAFPLPTGNEISVGSNLSGLSPFIAAYSLPSSINSTSVRLDHHVSEKYSIFFRFADTPTYTQARTLALLATRHFNTRTYTFGATAQINQATSNDVRFGYANGASTFDSVIDGFGGATPIDTRSLVGIPGDVASSEAQTSITIASVGTTSIDQRRVNNEINQWNLTDTLHVAAGHHVLSLGVDQRRIHSPLSPATPYIGAAFNSRSALLSDISYSASIQTLKPSEPIFQEFSAFVQDEWKIASTVVLSGGIRWEVNPPPGEASGDVPYTLQGNISQPSTLALAPHGTPLWKTTWFNLAPRLGVAWTAHTAPGHETVVRAGGGVFYDTGLQQAALGFSSVGFLGYKTFTNISLPVLGSRFNIPTDPTLPIPSVYAYPAHMQLPYALEWNGSLEQAFGRSQTLTVTYVGSEGRRLLQQRRYVVSALNPSFATVFYFPGGITSNYHALELKFQRSVAHGLQALMSYTWSHTLDYGSTDASFQSLYGNADFDLRNNVQAGLTWELPQSKKQGPFAHLLNGWGADGRLMARTAFPVSLTGNLLTDSTGASFYNGVNYDPTKPIYRYGAQYPGGRILNGGPGITDAAFTLPAGSTAGNAPRNFVRGFDAVQFNLALRREFVMSERLHLQFRAESFNLLNHANLGYIDPTLSDATFGQVTKMLNQSLGSVSGLYQQGGPRSIQLALKLTF